MKNARKPLSAMIALGAALAMPVAFAQDATTAPPQDPQQSAAPTGAQPLTWADLDVDGNGTLSKAEAGSLPSLAQVFDEADGDSNGELTPDEYKAYVASTNATQPEDGSGGDD